MEHVWIAINHCKTLNSIGPWIFTTSLIILFREVTDFLLLSWLSSTYNPLTILGWRLYRCLFIWRYRKMPSFCYYEYALHIVPKIQEEMSINQKSIKWQNCRNEYWTQYMNPVKLPISSNILGLCTYYHRVLIVIIPIYKLTIRLCKYLQTFINNIFSN